LRSSPRGGISQAYSFGGRLSDHGESPRLLERDIINVSFETL
jgi:hypothetical protein